ncbi:DoxX family protein [Roseivirga sp.]|uniref:DoxX family protein n=1 Tax=Roseivirga sp. TaxID=1964215 RepID=UPI003B51E99C
MMKTEKQQDIALLMLRLLVGLLIILHGIGNLSSGYAFIGSVMEGAGLPRFFAFGAFIGEIIAPILIIIGYRARMASLALVFTMFVAIVLAHAGDILALNQFGGWAIELQAFYLFTGLSIYFSGAGAYAISKTNRWD